jgi:hypothetical protein
MGGEEHDVALSSGLFIVTKNGEQHNQHDWPSHLKLQNSLQLRVK